MSGLTVVAMIVTMTRFQGFHSSRACAVLTRVRTTSVVAAAATVLLVLLNSCAGDHFDSLINFSLRANIRTSSGSPMEGVRLTLVDHKIPGYFRFKQKELHVCSTNPAGNCSATIRYRYSFTTSPWMTRERIERATYQRFELVARRGSKVIGRSFVPDLTPAQYSDRSEVQVTIDVEP
jgi:hypothetical protein